MGEEHIYGEKQQIEELIPEEEVERIREEQREKQRREENEERKEDEAGERERGGSEKWGRLDPV